MSLSCCMNIYNSRKEEQEKQRFVISHFFICDLIPEIVSVARPLGRATRDKHRPRVSKLPSLTVGLLTRGAWQNEKYPMTNGKFNAANSSNFWNEIYPRCLGHSCCRDRPRM